MENRSHTRQVIGSLLVALLIVAMAVVVVTARFGPTSTAELESREKIEKERIDLQEERLKQQEDAREEAQKQREDGG
jgi:electron transfer flavoprotein alpha subunit